MGASWQVDTGSQLASKNFCGFDRMYDLGNPGSARAFVATLDIAVDAALSLLRGEVRRVTPEDPSGS